MRTTGFGLLQDTEDLLYKQWKKEGLHLLEYGSEFFGTAVLMVVLVAIVAALFARGSPVGSYLSSPYLRLFLAGLTLGATCLVLALSPPGRLSGAHINPAFSTGMWLLGKMRGRDLLGYVAAQMVGALAGTFLGVWLMGAWARQINDAMLWPNHGISPLAACIAEILATGIQFFIVFSCLSHRRLMRLTPVIGMVSVAFLVCLDGDVSGCGINPARWFGPACLQHNLALAWVYVGGPLAGAAAAVAIRRSGLVERAIPTTGKLFHDPLYRSIFFHDAVPSAPPPRVALATTPAEGPKQ